MPPVTNRTCTMIIIYHDSTVHGDYGEVSCDVTDNTYNSAVTVQEVSAGVVISVCPQAGELLLGAGEGVHLNSGDSRSRDHTSSHHDPVL